MESIINNSIEVSNLNDFISIINNRELKDYYYRGENEKYTSITSSFLRNYESMFSRKQFYENLINSYYEEIAINISEFERSNFLAFSQHHGLKTNLIDITTSPLVALYFACTRPDDKENIGYVYLFNKSNVLDISELINIIFSPHRSSNIINELFINQNETVIKYFRLHLSSFYWNNDINPYMHDVYKCCEEIANSINLSGRFIDEYTSAIQKNKDVYELYELQSKYFRGLDSIGIPLSLTFYLNMLYLYFNDLNSASFLITKERDFRFPKMPYLIYKTPYKFDRIRNQEGLFLYQLYKDFALKEEDVIDNIIIQEVIPDITIKVYNQKEILDQLDFIGVNCKFIYGDYDNIAKYFNKKFFV